MFLHHIVPFLQSFDKRSFAGLHVTDVLSSTANFSKSHLFSLLSSVLEFRLETQNISYSYGHTGPQNMSTKFKLVKELQESRKR